jgi:hypothetical protein
MTAVTVPLSNSRFKVSSALMAPKRLLTFCIVNRVDLYTFAGTPAASLTKIGVSGAR